LCFIGTNAIDISHGLTDNDWEVVHVKKAMIESSQKVVSMVISEKLNTFQRIRICEIGDIDILITELPPHDQLLLPYQQAGLEII
jgi:DeoR/GlpR family transcriptional regulator of sugar metabolism